MSKPHSRDKVIFQHRFVENVKGWVTGNVVHHGQIQGKSWFSLFHRIAAKAIGIPEYLLPMYSGHSVRATGASFMADCEASVEQLMAFGSWKSESVARRYFRDLRKQKVVAAGMISGLCH